MTVGGTKSEYVVDIWSGNHPFFQAGPSPIIGGQVPMLGGSGAHHRGVRCP